MEQDITTSYPSRTLILEPFRPRARTWTSNLNLEPELRTHPSYFSHFFFIFFFLTTKLTASFIHSVVHSIIQSLLLHFLSSSSSLEHFNSSRTLPSLLPSTKTSTTPFLLASQPFLRRRPFVCNNPQPTPFVFISIPKNTPWLTGHTGRPRPNIHPLSSSPCPQTGPRPLSSHLCELPPRVSRTVAQQLPPNSNSSSYTMLNLPYHIINHHLAPLLYLPRYRHTHLEGRPMPR